MYVRIIYDSVVWSRKNNFKIPAHLPIETAATDMCLFFVYIWIFQSWNFLWWQFQDSFSFSCSVLYHTSIIYNSGLCVLCVSVSQQKCFQFLSFSYSLTLGLFWALSTRPFFLNLSNQVQASKRRQDRSIHSLLFPYSAIFFFIHAWLEFSDKLHKFEF